MPRGNRIVLMISGAAKQQADRDTPLDLADLDFRVNVTSRNWIEEAKTVEEILDCLAEEVVGKDVTRVLSRLPIEGEFSPAMVAPLAAYTYGQAAAPTGTTGNTSITFANTYTAGAYRVTFTYDGMVCQTAPIPWNATAAQFKRAIEDCENIGTGNTTVGLVGGTYTAQFINKRGSAAIPVPTLDAGTATGGVALVITRTVTGSQRAHAVTEISGYQPPYFTLGAAFEDEAGSENLLVGAVMSNLRITGANNNGKVTFAADIVARQVLSGEGLTIPDCLTPRPTRTLDCILTYDGDDITARMREFAFNYDNLILTTDHAYTGRGPKPTRLERATRRTRALTFAITGGVTEALYGEAKANPAADIKAAATLRIGTDGDNITVNIPNALLELQEGAGGLRFDGEAEEAVGLFQITPTKQGSTKPSNLVIEVPQSATFLAA